MVLRLSDSLDDQHGSYFRYTHVIARLFILRSPLHYCLHENVSSERVPFLVAGYSAGTFKDT